MKNWDDLRYLVAVHKTGSMSAAARLLETNPATVSRRLARLSETLGRDLFLKTPQGWMANRGISDLIESITAFENEIEAYLNAHAEVPEDLSGSISIGCPPFVGSYVLYPGMRDFLASHKGLKINFTGQFYQDALGDNDMFVSSVRPQQGRLVVRFLGKYAMDVFRYPDSPDTGEWIGLQKKHDGTAIYERAASHFENREPVLRVETYNEVLRAVQATRLPGMLPCIVAESDIGLTPYSSVNNPLQVPLYLCFHETRRKDPLLQLVADWITDRFNAVSTL